MSSKRRRAASRANGKKSQGPVTPEGKARSSANATRHGLAAPGRLADSVCLTIENRAEFVQLHETFVAWHAPANPVEHLIVEEMAVARWRLQRAWVMETSLLENQMDRMTDTLEKDYETMNEGTRLTLAFRDLAEQSPSLSVLQRYESRLSRQFERCLKQLTALRSASKTPELVEMPNDPNPKNEHSQTTAQSLESTPPAASQPAPDANCGRQPAVTPAQSAFEVGTLHPGPQRNDSETRSEPAPALPRAA
jgi:hypothetical protein